MKSKKKIEKQLQKARRYDNMKILPRSRRGKQIFEN